MPKMRSLVVLLLLGLIASLGGCFLFPNQAPVAAFTVTYNVDDDPMAILLDASTSSDPDGDAIVSYSWAFSDDLEIISPAAYSKLVTEPELIVKCPTEGTYSVQLLVRDEQGAASAIASRDIVVPNPEVEPTE